VTGPDLVSIRLTAPIGPWSGPLFLVDVGARAFPMFKMPTVRSAFLLPNEIGAFADPALQPVLLSTLPILLLLTCV
jgi:hypothetical protein